MTTHLSQKRAFESPKIPDRLYFKIGDVARICSLETYVLRFWESQFPQLKPNKSGTGHRLYCRRDIELVLEIKRLVHSEGYTLAGARQVIRQVHHRLAPQQDPRQEPHPGPQPRISLLASDSGQRLDAVAATIGHARAELRKIAGLLASPLSRPSRRRTPLATVPKPSDLLFPF